ncbi:MAG TPA: MoxR family ATPase [Candidatus Hydrogenedentes bacterium]|nr:MoxR family ATPase [Candidatus Hydrogenedentota bacterium]
MNASDAEQIRRLIDNIEQVIFGKREVVKLCVTGLLARGHLLIEDIPGIGKTTLAQGLARSIDCSFHRIQFTSDMLPSDILGVSVLDPKTAEFVFRPGPIFASIVLADEINRTPPKTQSALLEAMSEQQVSVDGRTYPVARPFMVIATQNPIEYEGTYTLPESQLDRFMLRVDMGYPPGRDELRIMRRRDPAKALGELKPALTAQEVIGLQDAVGDVRVDDSVAEYVLAIVQATREHDHVQLGASPRGSLALFETAQARALIEGRDYVTPGDVKELAVSVLSHRLIVRSRSADLVAAANERAGVIVDILKSIPVPV